MKKIFFLNIILIILVLNVNIKPVFADNDKSASDIFSGGDSFVNVGENRVDKKKLIEFSDMMANALIGIGTAIAVIYSVVLGIKFMMGSMEEKAEIKESLVPFIIGCIVLFGAFTIWKIVINIGNKI